MNGMEPEVWQQEWSRLWEAVIAAAMRRAEAAKTTEADQE